MKKISLTQGKYAIVDDDDYVYLSQWKWYFGNGYARRTVNFKNKAGTRVYRAVLMHREVNQTPEGQATDHRNFDKLDNRKSNLVSCTYSENNHHQRVRPGSKTSKYKGVSRKRANQKWQAYIAADKKSHYLGVFPTEEEAALAYNRAAIKMHGKFAILNDISEF